jgi:hypothetical protein
VSSRHSSAVELLWKNGTMLGPANTGLGACDWVRCTPATNCTPFLAAPPESTKPRPLPAPPTDPAAVAQVPSPPVESDEVLMPRKGGGRGVRTDGRSVQVLSGLQHRSLDRALVMACRVKKLVRVRTELARLGQARPCVRAVDGGSSGVQAEPVCAVPRGIEATSKAYTEGSGGAAQVDSGFRFHSTGRALPPRMPMPGDGKGILVQLVLKVLDRARLASAGSTAFLASVERLESIRARRRRGRKDKDGRGGVDGMSDASHSQVRVPCDDIGQTGG